MGRAVWFGGGQYIDTPRISSSMTVRHRGTDGECRLSLLDLKPMKLAKTVAPSYADRPPGHAPSQVIGGQFPDGEDWIRG